MADIDNKESDNEGQKFKLFQSCREGNEDSVGALLSSGVHVDSLDSNGRSGLIISSIYGHDTITELLLRHGARVNIHDKYGNTAFLEACKNGNDKVLQFLIERGGYDKNRGVITSMFMAACRNGHVKTVELLLKYGEDRTHEKQDPTPLMRACENGHIDVANLLIENGACVNECGRHYGQTALIDASRSGHVKMVEFLIQKGAKIDVGDSKIGVTALMSACRKGYYDVVFMLMEHGADVNACDGNGENALMRACNNGHIAVVELLLSRGVDIDTRDQNGETALTKACVNGHICVVECLVKRLLDDETSRDTGGFKSRCRKIFRRLVGLLLVSKRHMRNASNISDLRDNSGETLLMKAGWHGHVDVAAFLLAQGVHVDAVNTDGKTALTRACENGRVEVVDLLIQRGAYVQVCARNGCTPLMEAVKNGHVVVVELLIQHGGDVNSVYEDGTTTLMKACEAGNDKVVEMLLRCGAKVNTRSKDGGKTALMSVCQGRTNRANHRRIVELLFQHGALPDLVDQEGQKSAAMMAVLHDNVHCLEAMLPWSPNLDLKDSEGRTVFSYAMNNKSRDCLRVLLVDKVLLHDGNLKPVHKNSTFFTPSVFQNLLLTIEMGVFEWNWCVSGHYNRTVILAAFRAGFSPPSSISEGVQFMVYTPLIWALMFSFKDLVETFVSRLYFLPEDYNTLCSDSHVREQVNQALLDSIIYQPLSLQAWSFLTISQCISLAGPPGLRYRRVDSLPIPDRLKRKLLFKD